MKHLLPYLFLVSLSLSACEEPFDAELDSSEPRIVVEAWLTDIDKPPGIVRLTRTQAYFDTSAAEPINGALVLMTDLNTGRIDTLRPNDNPDRQHVYRGKDIQPTPGHRYVLEIYVEGQYFHAESDMIPMTAIDSLTTSVFTETDETEPEFFIIWNGLEPPEPGQCYYTHRRNFHKGKQRFR